MVSFVPTSRVFRWPSAVTWPCGIALVLYPASIGAFAWLNQQTQHDFAPCLFKNVTGAPCFLCGGTRASFSLAKGDLVSAFLFNPLVSAVLILAVALTCLKVVAGLRIKVAPHARSWLWLAAISAVAVNWIFVFNHL